MKQIARALLRRAGYVVVTTGHAGVRYLEAPPRTSLDAALLRVFPDLRGLGFIQVGANDGRRGDPICDHIRRFGWRGVMVEPVPEFFRALQENYRGQPGLVFVNAAVDAAAGTRTLHQVRADWPDLPDWTRGLASFDPQHVRSATRQFGLPEAAYTTVAVPTTTWADVVSKLEGRRCDVLVVDAEGFDVTLLRLANLAALRPRVIQFEHGATAFEQRLSFYAELLRLGYELTTSGPDTVAHLPPDAP